MSNNLPSLVYFEIKNTNGNRIYTLPQNEVAFIKVAIYIPDEMLDAQFKDDDFSICCTVNNAVVQYENIPVQEIIRTNKHILQIEFKLDTHLTESINLNLSLHSSHSTITPQEQIKQFSFFKTTIERKNISSSENGKNKEPSKKVLRFDNEDWTIPSDNIKNKNPKKYKKRYNDSEKQD